MNKITQRLKNEFKDEETRYIYGEDFLNTYIATQIKVLREKAGWTQAQLAEKAGMKQERISVLEDVNYSAWTANVLKRIARALGMRLSIKIEDYGSYLNEFENFDREELIRYSFEEDPTFNEALLPAAQTENATIIQFPKPLSEDHTEAAVTQESSPLEFYEVFERKQNKSTNKFASMSENIGKPSELQYIPVRLKVNSATG